MTDIYHYDWLNIHAGDNFNEPIRYSTDLALRSISLANLKYFKKNFSIYFTRNANLFHRCFKWNRTNSTRIGSVT